MYAPWWELVQDSSSYHGTEACRRRKVVHIGGQRYTVGHSGTQWGTVGYSSTQWYTVVDSGGQWGTVGYSGGGGADKHVDSLLPLFAPRTINPQHTCTADTVPLLCFIIGSHFKGLTPKSTWPSAIVQCVADFGPKSVKRALSWLESILLAGFSNGHLHWRLGQIQDGKTCV